VLEALLTEIIIWTYKLLNPREKLGFPKYLAFIEKNIDIFSIEALQRRKNYPDGHLMLRREPITLETIKRDRRRLRDLDEAIASIKLRRNRFYAHFDKRHFTEPTRLFEKSVIKWT
jgi:hypothetical protein